MTGIADDTSVEIMTSEQRAATVDLLADLTDTDWSGPTMCSGWTVAHLAAHLSMPFEAKGRARHFGVEIGDRTLSANDVDFTIGNGPTTTMPAATMIMTLTGRIALSD